MEKREKSSRLIIFIVFIPFLIWILLQFIAPIALPSSSVNDLTGHTGIKDNENIINEMPSPWNSIYDCGDTLCHQKSERSFFISGNQMPFCSRCTAIWLGLVIGLGFLIFYKIALDEKFILLIILGLTPIGIDGVGQLLGFWESSNFIRVITGLLVGIVCGLAIGLIIDEIREMYISRKSKSS
jgi:uncharacterized membrane protein